MRWNANVQASVSSLGSSGPMVANYGPCVYVWLYTQTLEKHSSFPAQLYVQQSDSEVKLKLKMCHNFACSLVDMYGFCHDPHPIMIIITILINHPNIVIWPSWPYPFTSWTFSLNETGLVPLPFTAISTGTGRDEPITTPFVMTRTEESRSHCSKWPIWMQNCW